MLSLHQSLSSLLLLSTLTAISHEELRSVNNEEFSAEGSTVTLSYNYTKVNPTDYFFWYRQYPGQAPEFLLSRSASGQEAAPTSGLSIKVEQNLIHMIISSAAVTDSAVYYCAVKPTVTGNYTTLYKNSSCQKPPLLTAHLSFLPPLEGDITHQKSSFLICLFLYMLCSSSECDGDDRVMQPTGGVTAAEGETLTLGCTFQTNDPTPTLLWYKQQVNDFPKLLLRRFSTQADNPAERQRDRRMDAAVNQTSFPLKIQKLQLSDSAVYYCALQPTVTGNYTTLYKNLWSKDNTPHHPLEGVTHYMLLHLFLFLSPFIAMGSMYSITPESPEEVVSEGRHINLTCKYNGSIDSIQWYRQQQRSRPEFLLYITEDGSIHPTLSDFSAHINQTEKRVKLQISSAAVTDSAVYYCAVKPTVTGNYTTLYKNLWSKDNTPHHPPEGVTHC
ncbi:uncharacterized protein LOC117778388 [Hippoglossus hippoglossus]|uniref:uncharacterized protein LOC117778388 n=1 Tax=Hippoglossus hippoglossus TaxID=8267 RepID=UPI00148C9A31|nr:uncharacterized protein LOC117778388 [Hippoglossus hippoglossus]